MFRDLERYVRTSKGKTVDVRKWFEVPAQLVLRKVNYSVGDVVLFGKKYTYHLSLRDGKYFMRLE